MARPPRLQALTLLLLVVSICALAGCGGSANAEPRPGNGPVVQFSASPASLKSGETVTLTWAVQNATSLTIAPPIQDDDDHLAMSGSKVLFPKQTTTWTLTAQGPGGTTTAAATATVQQVAPTITLSAAPAQVLPGGTATLTWQSTNADTIVIDNGVGQVAAPSGSVSVKPAATTTYTATATGPGGTATAVTTVTVAAPSQLAVSFAAQPDTIAVGATATLTWASQNATSVSIQPGIGAVNLSGSVTVKPKVTTNYTATATDASGNQATATATVNVLDAAGLQNIKHIIFFVQENRSFDHYFGMLGRYRAARGIPGQIDNLDLNTTLIDIAGHPVKPYKQRTLVHWNLSPSWNETHYAVHYQNGSFAMDRFLLTQGGAQTSQTDPHFTRVMSFYDERDLPFYYELASQFATSDRFFSSVMAGTVPNRTFLFSATSGGFIHPNLEPAPSNLKSIFRALTEAGVFWRYYYMDDSVHYGYYDEFATYGQHVWPIDDYFNILSRPTADQDLPQVVFIEHAGTSQLALDEHPFHHIQEGAAKAREIMMALMNSEAWKSSVFLHTYDEFGGFYDHVPPFPVPNPDGIAPHYSTNDSGTWDNFTFSGLRVPLIVVSPWVRKNYVSHTPMEFASILKLIETRFNVPPLTQRDASAPDMLEFFDFSQPAWLTPPPLPAQPIECTGDPSSPSTPDRCAYRLEAEPNHPQ